MENQASYRIRTKLGETEPINIPLKLTQEYNSFEILSLKINTNDTYRSYTSNEGIVVGRVSTANNGLGIPNVRVSIFVPKGMYSQSDEEAVLYPFSSPTDLDGDRVHYNLLPSETDVECYQVVGTLPTKRKVLDNETVCEVFEKYYKYTTVTNESGDFMLTNIPVGKQRIHIDADLSDIGPFLSQKPYMMIENNGIDKNKFENSRQFKTSKDLDSLVQIISQNKSVYVYPYWGDITENGSDMKITRTDLSLNYDFKTSAVFMGSVITDKGSNGIMQNCTPVEKAGKMSDMITGPGRIEMIRKTVDNKIEQYKIKGDSLIDTNGVWCYSIPMNLDYVRTDEFGNIIPTDDPNKGVPTRARVRFRITLNEMDSDEDTHKRCSYLVPNNPKYDDEIFLNNDDADYSFGSETWDESFVDLFMNKVYTVKSYIPRLQKNNSPTNRKHTGIKMVNHFGDNNPFPYNSLSIKLSFQNRIICSIVHIFITLVEVLNGIISTIGFLPCTIAEIKIFKIRPFKVLSKAVPKCIAMSSEFCDDGINKNVTYPGCYGCTWTLTKRKCSSNQEEIDKNNGESSVCLNKTSTLYNCVENQLVQENESTSFNFGNDWINGCLYMPLWYRKIKPKKTFFFGLFRREAKDQYCAGNGNGNADGNALKITTFCSPQNKRQEAVTNLNGSSKNVNILRLKENCGDKCHEVYNEVPLTDGVIKKRQTMLGQTVWYYKAVDVSSTINKPIATEYVNAKGVHKVSKTLYATDIVLLGSLTDCDLNGIPKFFNYLKSTTYNMPTDVLFTDTEITYSSDEDDENVSQTVQKISVASGCDWGNANEYGYKDGGLFYSIGCTTSSIKVTTGGCVNLRRMCELGVGQDEIKYIENINNNENLDYNDIGSYLRPDGFISYDDLNDFEYRSMFATMNGNRLATKLNKETGVYEYDLRHFYIDNFDGSLKEIMKDVQKGREKANYKGNWNLEEPNKDYLLFRFGDNPYFYDGGDIVERDGQESRIKDPKNYALPKYQNSFYFYFGLKEGKTAIDLFNQQFNEKCASEGYEMESIPYEVVGNSWCAKDEDDCYEHSNDNYDGYLKINLENIPLPCSMIFNSKSNSSVTYTVVTKEESDSNTAEVVGQVCPTITDCNASPVINDERICFGNYVDSDYAQYYFKYEEGNVIRNCQCHMLNNGDYDLFITDGEGNYHSFIVEIKNKRIEFESFQENFKQPNNVLLDKYGEYIEVPSGTVNISRGNDGVPSVTRQDGNLNIKGFFCLYDVMSGDDNIKDFRIVVTTDDEELKDNFEIDVYIVGGNLYDGYEGAKGSKYIKVDEEIEDVYVITFPKGDVYYSIKITQLCVKTEGEETYINETLNYVGQKVFIAQPTPYKLFINEVDYDIIKNFKTGFSLQTKEGMQWNDKPFDSVNIAEVIGWDKISEIAQIQDKNGKIVLTNYNWSIDEEKYGKTDDTFKTDDDYGYELLKFLAIKEKKEPKEPQRADFDDELSYSEAMNKWANEHDQWENGKIDDDGNRVDGYNEPSINEDDQIGGVCGYVYIKEAARPLQNRLDFLTTMKNAFWLQSEKLNISFRVQTDETPYDVWAIYNPEKISSYDEDYHETESDKHGSIESWICVGEHNPIIDDVMIPTITSVYSEDYGTMGDTTTDKYSNGTICFARDNIAQYDKENGSISIKPPYLVACVNNDGMTKPADFTIENFFAKKNNKYLLGNVENNKGFVVKDGKEFFGFHIIDKIFKPDIVCWSYINDIPYFRPELDYNKPVYTHQEGDVVIPINTVKTNGILSGNIFNGTTNVYDGSCTDFDERNIFNSDVQLMRYDGDTEDSIPTRRCIIHDKYNDGIYIDYCHIISEVDKDQYIEVPNTEGELTFSDLDATHYTERKLYGSMKITLKGTSINDSKNLLNVACSNVDDSENVTYYVFKLGTNLRLPSNTSFSINYPINEFKYNDKYTLDCKDGSINKWNGTNSSQIFNKNTNENVLKELVDVNVKSSNEYINSDYETVSEDSKGYGNTGEFTGIKSNKKYFVVATLKNGCRAISPVYDFTDVKYMIGLKLGKDNTCYLRIAVGNVLPTEGEIPNIYYLSRFNFTIEFTYENDGVTITENNILFDSSEGKTKDADYHSKIDYITNANEVGKTWIDSVGSGNEQEWVMYKRIENGFVSIIDTEETSLITDINDDEVYRYILRKDKVGDDYVSTYAYIQFNQGVIKDVSVTTDSKELKEGEVYTYSYTTTEEGQTVTNYCKVEYIRSEITRYAYNPVGIPYFMHYKEITYNDEDIYNALKKTLSKKSRTKKAFDVYVTDCTGLRHKCDFSELFENDEQDEWKKVINNSKRER